MSWRPGAVVGDYRLVSRLAVGGTAEVWLATAKGAGGGDEPVALKTMRPAAAGSPEQVRSFAAEAEIAGKLSHPNIVRMLSAGRAGDRYCMAMEYVSGLTLRGVARALRLMHQRLPLWLLTKMALEACGALHYAHEFTEGDRWMGFVHRDVSPDNLMIVPAGGVKVIDFGSARLGANPRTTGAFMGKLRYAAPERVQGLPEDRRCDIYSLGVVLYEQAVGTPPFVGDDMSVISRIVEGRATPPRKIVPDLPPPFEQIILRAMARDPANRHPTALAMANDLRRFLEQALPRPAEAESAERLLEPVFRLPGAWVPPGPGAREVVEERAGAAGTEVERFAPDAHESHDDEVTRRSLLLSDLDPEPWAVESPDVSERLPAELTPVVTVAAPAPPPASPPNEPPAPPPTAPSLVAVPWLFERRQAPLAAPSGLFGRQGRDGDTPDHVFAGRPEPTSSFAAADAFAIHRGRSAETAASWRSAPGPGAGTSSPATTPALPHERRRPPNEEAARCFDRGLMFVTDKKYQLALEQWERATELDPDNRLYQANLRRLRAQGAGRDRPPTHNGE